MARVRKNERSWAIELISLIDRIASRRDWCIKKAGGESTVRVSAATRMFPDVLLYADSGQQRILQGWEVKMPDVSIDDPVFVADAQRKAKALGMNSCLLWNFTYVRLYTCGEGGEFRMEREWDATAHIRSRDDVERFRSDWEQLLEQVLCKLNEYFVTGACCDVPLDEFIARSAIGDLVCRNKGIVEECLSRRMRANAVDDAHLSLWWRSVQNEYRFGEEKKEGAYAKTILLHWVSRFLFAQLIKRQYNAAGEVDDINADCTPAAANEIFRRITEKCDFYNIFSPLEYSDTLPEVTWANLTEYNRFLSGAVVERMDQEALQRLLELTVSTVQREIYGMFPTPPALARILVRLAVRDWNAPVLDCCCGTGAIAGAAIRLKKEKGVEPVEAVRTVWASDKNRYPLLIANIALSSVGHINVPLRLFPHNALDLAVNEVVRIVNPETGRTERLHLPSFPTIVSNLPFVAFENIPDDDRQLIKEHGCGLGRRADLFATLALRSAELLTPDGTCAFITSTSWLGTLSGLEWYRKLRTRYHILQVHVSGKGRWFRNADVVTTILVLQKRREGEPEKGTTFCLWKSALEDIAADPIKEEDLVLSALLGKNQNTRLLEMSTYSVQQIETLVGMGVSLNACFHRVQWLSSLSPQLVPLTDVFEVCRGSRRGWDELFYPKAGTHRIESRFLRPVLLSSRNVTRLSAQPDGVAFCCRLTEKELLRKSAIGAAEWIHRFENKTNGKGRPLPEVLSQGGLKWYEFGDTPSVEFVTALNPDRKLFFAWMETPGIINQRLVGLTRRRSSNDAEWLHALLNSVLTMFYIEACGFGRGLGVLDMNKSRCEGMRLLNPELVEPAAREPVLKLFRRLKQRSVLPLEQEMQQKDRQDFDDALFAAYGLGALADSVRSSLLSLHAARCAARLGVENGEKGEKTKKVSDKA